jgi:hypothetical protein
MRKRPPDQLVMSFHGVPERTLHLGDPYHCECMKTRAAGRTGLEQGAVQGHVPVAPGPRQMAAALHRAHLDRHGKAGLKRVDVVCPGFTSDCLETLEEINMEARQAFLHAGGKELSLHRLPQRRPRLDQRALRNQHTASRQAGPHWQHDGHAEQLARRDRSAGHRHGSQPISQAVSDGQSSGFGGCGWQVAPPDAKMSLTGAAFLTCVGSGGNAGCTGSRLL